MFYNYILKSRQNGQMYTGYTVDLRKRFKEHNEGKSTYTKHRGPYDLIYYEACLNEEDAKAREKYLDYLDEEHMLSILTAREAVVECACIGAGYVYFFIVCFYFE